LNNQNLPGLQDGAVGSNSGDCILRPELLLYPRF